MWPFKKRKYVNVPRFYGTVRIYFVGYSLYYEYRPDYKIHKTDEQQFQDIMNYFKRFENMMNKAKNSYVEFKDETTDHYEIQKWKPSKFVGCKFRVLKFYKKMEA